MRAMTLSGWGQPHDALKAIAPEATHVEYAHHESVPGALETIARTGESHDLVIGWSLGGQLAVRAIAAGLLTPQRLVLIAAPFQFVEQPERRLGMKRDLYDKFRDNYARNPERTLHKAWELICLDDNRADDVRARLQAQDKTQVLAKDWLRWLDMLDGFSCGDLDFGRFPPTLLIHGDRDAVVAAGQAQHFADRLAQPTVALMENAGHAPHWHNGEAVRRLIAGYAHV
ncbi:MAG: alpha/beta fold hydrolase [Pseudomonadota bacterium]|nr:alpha/beta fold hydrolase [Pseudomonadota bacterium]